MWRDRRFRPLDSDGRVLSIYFRSSPHHNMCGCYRVPDAYAAADLVWPIDLYIAVRARLEEAGLILFDEDTDEVYVVGWFEVNAPKGPKQDTGCVRQIEQIESDRLRARVTADFKAARTEEQDPKVIALNRRSLS
ncbi:hypothetical protein CK215_14475 [Mesorhizobium sp. WSM3864]|nr:hypothetical protein CK215_14475 [Mesorhizobium sp. WSM3864]